ncbi:MAG TPA: hypothetical protein VGO99_06655 [Leifsonia sp.]|nr:ATP-dependent ligase [Microbacteriaceae bacterium]HEV7812628.1 hypothetical protein [Leifsonia sp.]
MGKLIYGSLGTHIELDDRTLAHLKFVIIMKLRRDEKFTLSWQHGQEGGGGRTSIWIHPTIPLQFEFNGGKPPQLNKTWIEELMTSANSTGGLQVLAEPAHTE